MPSIVRGYTPPPEEEVIPEPVVIDEVKPEETIDTGYDTADLEAVYDAIAEVEAMEDERVEAEKELEKVVEVEEPKPEPIQYTAPIIKQPDPIEEKVEEFVNNVTDLIQAQFIVGLYRNGKIKIKVRYDGKEEPHEFEGETEAEAKENATLMLDALGFNTSNLIL